MSRFHGLIGLLAAASMVAVAPAALAGPDVSGSADIAEPIGFPDVCDQPCFTVRKEFEVYLDGNATVPAGANCPVGENTYLYKIVHTGGSGTPIGFVPGVTKFELGVDTSNVSSAGHIAGFGVDPSATNVIVSPGDRVEWDFLSPLIANGGMSTKLFVCSPLLPGNLTDSMVSIDGQLALDAPGTCVGPLFEPTGEPLPCTIGFWKSRAAGKQGLLKFFPDPDFDDVVDQAVALSNGVFADANALLTDLQSKGNRPAAQRARQQLAAVLLDLAAGDLFPGNTKCKLDEGNVIDSNSCGDNITLGVALQGVFDDIAMGNFGDAKDCSDDINNGVGVVGANQGE